VRASRQPHINVNVHQVQKSDEAHVAALIGNTDGASPTCLVAVEFNRAIYFDAAAIPSGIPLTYQLPSGRLWRKDGSASSS